MTTTRAPGESSPSSLGVSPTLPPPLNRPSHCCLSCASSQTHHIHMHQISATVPFPLVTVFTHNPFFWTPSPNNNASAARLALFPLPQPALFTLYRSAGPFRCFAPPFPAHNHKREVWPTCFQHHTHTHPASARKQPPPFCPALCRPHTPTTLSSFCSRLREIVLFFCFWNGAPRALICKRGRLFFFIGNVCLLRARLFHAASIHNKKNTPPHQPTTHTHTTSASSSPPFHPTIPPIYTKKPQKRGSAHPTKGAASAPMANGERRFFLANTPKGEPFPEGGFWPAAKHNTTRASKAPRVLPLYYNSPYTTHTTTHQTRCTPGPPPPLRDSPARPPSALSPSLLWWAARPRRGACFPPFDRMERLWKTAHTPPLPKPHTPPQSQRGGELYTPPTLAPSCLGVWFPSPLPC